MTDGERIAAWVAVAAVIFTAGGAWVSLSDRVQKVDDKIVAIQKVLGSTPCTAILDRQLAAIDRGRADVRKALDGLSNQYGCVAARDTWTPRADITMDATQMNAAANHGRPSGETRNLVAALNAVDVQLNKKR